MNDTTRTPRLEAKILASGELIAETGLHIGGNSVGMEIGGADSVVVRNPLTNEPYIPGSSLRGKMRSLMERVRGDEKHNEEGGFSVKTNKKGELEVLAGKDPGTLLGRFFGTSAETGGTPTRLTVRDCPLLPDSVKILNSAPNTDMPMTEVKTEVWIDRITSAANPRQIERVPAGARFRFAFVVDVLDGDDEKQWLALLKEGMRLIETDSLGGSGSRGYGQVRFDAISAVKRTAAWYRQPDASHETPLDFDFRHD